MKTGRTWEAKSGSVGEYSVQGLPVGPYKVEVAQQGFKTEVISNIILHPAESPRADLTLDIGSAGETINVSADAATVNTTTSESGATIDSKSVVEPSSKWPRFHLAHSTGPRLRYHGRVRAEQPGRI